MEKISEWHAKAAADPNVRVELMQETNNLFLAADKDGDSRLNEEEYFAFMKTFEAAQAARYGETPIHDDKEIKEQYEAYNKLTTDVEGISIQDVGKIRVIFPAVKAKI